VLKVTNSQATVLWCHGGNEEEIHVRERKGGKARTVPLPHDLAEGLLAWLRVRAAHAAPGKEALFVNLKRRKAQGQRLRAWTIRKRLAEKLQELGAPERYHGPHSMRHLAGTRLYRATGDLYVVAALLGHADVSTSQLYDKMDRSKLRKAVQPLSKQKARQLPRLWYPQPTWFFVRYYF